MDLDWAKAFASVMFDIDAYRANGLADKTFMLKTPYPPSVAALADLKNISVAELRGESHHRGRMLWLHHLHGKAFVSATKIVFSMHDITGFPMLLEIPLGHPALVQDKLLLRPRVVVAIKEPFFTMSEHAKAFAVRVDHLSDMVIQHCAGYPAPVQLSINVMATSSTLPSAGNLKKEGNELLKQGKTFAADFLYSQALRVVTKSEVKLKHDLYRNRSEARLRLGYYAGAKEDALAAQTDGTDEHAMQLNAKAFYQAARASYGLRDYNGAVKLAATQLQCTPSDTQGRDLIAKAQARLHEEATGEYDFVSILAALGPANPYVDAASYTKRSVVKDSKSQDGRGMFAAEDIAEGEIVLCEKAVYVAYCRGETAHTIKKFNMRTAQQSTDNFDLWRGLANGLMHNPPQLDQVNLLTATHGMPGFKTVKRENRPVIDTFDLHDRIVTNRFECRVPQKEHTEAIAGFWSAADEVPEHSYGLWAHCSLINHDCLANTERTFIGDMLLLRSTRAIAAGEEITVRYLRPDTEHREALLRQDWGFQCACPLCTDERAATCLGAVEEALGAAEVTVKVLRGKSRWNYWQHVPSNQDIEAAREALDTVNAAYDKAGLAKAPRLGTLGAHNYLMNAYILRGEYKALVGQLTDCFRAIGYDDIDLEGPNVQIRATRFAFFGECTPILTLLTLSDYRRKRGDVVAAEGLRALARRLYCIVNGVESGFDKIEAARLPDKPLFEGNEDPRDKGGRWCVVM